LKRTALIDEVPLAHAARLGRGRESCTFRSFNDEWCCGRKIREIYLDCWLSEIFEKSRLCQGVDSNGRGSALTDSCSNVGLESSGLVSIGEARKGNGDNYGDYGANNE